MGFSYIKRGFQFFLKNRKLWLYAAVPTAINLLILAALIALLAHYYGDLTGWIFGSENVASADVGFFVKVWHGFLGALIYIAKVLIFIILLVLLFITTFIFSLILTEPFNDALSEKVEQLITGKEIPFNWNYFVKSISRSVIVGLQKAAFFLSIPLLLLLINIIPLVGSIIYLVLANLFAAFDIGFNFTDYPMSRKLWSFNKRMKTAWAKKYYFVGFGIIVLIPLFPYFFAAPLVTGGTLMFSEVASDESE
jgi:CysZ protein